MNVCSYFRLKFLILGMKLGTNYFFYMKLGSMVVPYRKTTSYKTNAQEDYLTGRQYHRKTTSQEDCLSGRQPHKKMTSQEDSLAGRR